jgi:SAM-dependent methyltransferase
MPSLDDTLELLRLFGDATRVRLMKLLAAEELSVTELTAVTDLPQSRVSTHLGRLREAGLLRDRRVGASTFYAINEGAIPAPAQHLWQLLSAQVEDRVLEADRLRADELKRARETAGSWPDTIAGEMERHYSPGRTWEATARALLGFARLGDVLEIGSGDGVIAQLIAPRARTVSLLDRSPKMIEAARRRLGDHDALKFVVGDMHDLPFSDSSFDEVLCFNALTFAERPERALAEAARVLRPGGKLGVVTLALHSQVQVTAGYSHVNAGFRPAELRAMLEQAGLDVELSEVTSRERRKPYFEVVTAFSSKPTAARSRLNGGRRRKPLH